MNTLESQQPASCCAAGAEESERQYVRPFADIRETPDGYKLKLEMPGVEKSGLEVLLEDNELTIIGRRTPVTTQGEVLHRESNDSDYRRAFVLDSSVDATRISAKLENGVLHLDLPKAETVKPRKITVTG